MHATALQTAIAVALLAPSLAAARHGHDALEACLEAASAIKAGTFVKVEKLSVVQGGETTYEIEVRDSKGVEWELMCAAEGARIYEIEKEVKSADDPAFAKLAKVNRQTAAATATGMFPGKIEETEYEIEANGDPSYEFDIVDADGTEFKVEVDAVTGRIIEVAIETWEIGEEPDERR